jgi:mercuric ion binding protein
MRKLLFIALAAAATSMPAAAADKTVVLSVPGMNCELCPITVKKAISKVPGVKSVEASYEKKQAIVTFDDAMTTVDALTKATANAGYPSSLAR